LSSWSPRRETSRKTAPAGARSPDNRESAAEGAAVSRISQGRFQFELSDVSLDELVQGVVDELSVQADRAACTLSLKCEACTVGTWDRTRLEQVNPRPGFTLLHFRTASKTLAGFESSTQPLR
jgi:hypothetical protein